MGPIMNPENHRSDDKEDRLDIEKDKCELIVIWWSMSSSNHVLAEVRS